MKKFFTVVACIMAGTVLAFGQTSKEERVQKILERNHQEELFNAQLEDTMLGFHQGIEYSYRSFGTLEIAGAKKNGVHYLAGYRFSRHWYVGGIVGVDVTTPFKIEMRPIWGGDAKAYAKRKDKIYIPAIADIRFYFAPKRVSTFLFANIGAEFSTSTASVTMFGIGWDILTSKYNCVNIGLGLGMGAWESVGEESMLPDGTFPFELYDGFAFGLKLGYSF